MKFLDDSADIGTIKRYPNFPFEDFLTEHGKEWKSYDAADHKEFAVDCPECVNRGEPHPDTKKKLWINTETGYFTCYRCGWSGSFLRLIQNFANCRFEDAIKIVRGKGIDAMGNLKLLLHHEKAEKEEHEEELREIELPYGYQPIEKPHPYLEKRGVPLSYAKANDWGISTAGYTKDRIIVPTFMEHRLVFWQARATWESDDEDFRKVLNPKGVSARAILYNYDIAKSFDDIVIVEGFMDSVKAGANSVATNGKRLHPHQVEWLYRAGIKTITLAWDADAWTDARLHKKTGKVLKPCSMKQATDLLRSYGFKVKAARFPPKRDPGSFRYGSRVLERILAEAKEPKFK